VQGDDIDAIIAPKPASAKRTGAREITLAGSRNQINHGV
jgi:hypothetical protein